MTVRPFQEQDREQTLAFLDDARAIDSSGHHLHVVEEDAALRGVSLWFATSRAEGRLATIHTAEDQPRHTFYDLAAAACRDAIATGLSEGTFELRNPALLRSLQRDFAIDPRPSAWDPISREPIQWKVTVDLRDALQQLETYV